MHGEPLCTALNEILCDISADDIVMEDEPQMWLKVAAARAVQTFAPLYVCVTRPQRILFSQLMGVQTQMSSFFFLQPRGESFC